MCLIFRYIIFLIIWLILPNFIMIKNIMSFIFFLMIISIIWVILLNKCFVCLSEAVCALLCIAH